MSSSGECELDSESTPAVTHGAVAAAAAALVAAPKMVETSGGKKTVYVRKKSGSAMLRKISAELGSGGGASKKSTVVVRGDGIETEEESDSGPSSSSSPSSGKSSSERYLSPRPAPLHHHHGKHRSHHHSSSNLRKHVLVRRSPSPSMSPGYEQYQMALLEVPMPRDYGEASSDDLSSEWDSDAPDSRSRFLGSFKVKLSFLLHIFYGCFLTRSYVSLLLETDRVCKRASGLAVLQSNM